jgi:pimeloyl-ACP methyl ester carboxylesterase
VCLLFSLAVVAWNQIVTRRLHERNPVPGNFYSVDGHQMHLYCSGEGSPTILIEAGLGHDWLDWQGVQPELSRLTRVCTYDRSGSGWSEPRPGPRDAETIARQLHTLLNRAGMKRPLVLAGHSGGGFYIREFVREFPDESAAVVFIDSASPQQFDELPGFRASYEEFLSDRPRKLWWERLRIRSGLQRLAGHCRGTPPKNLASLAGQYASEKCRPEYEGADFGEYVDLETAAKQAVRLTDFGSKPLLIISRDPNRRTEKMTPEDEKVLAEWDREQETLKSLSPMSWRVIARDSGHEIYDARPDVVIGEVSRLLTYLRGGPAPRFGSTTAE